MSTFYVTVNRKPVPLTEHRVSGLQVKEAAIAAGVDQPTECDTLAAHKLDPDRMAAGVDMESIVPRLAIAACEAAVAQYPGEARFHYLLGRAFLSANRTADSIAQFQRAAEAGYAMANYNLGLAYEEAGKARAPFQTLLANRITRATAK